MKFGFSVISSSEVSELLGDVSNVLEMEMASLSELSEWGDVFDSFVIGLIAVEAGAGNDGFVKRNHRTGRFTHPITKEKVKYLSIALAYDPEAIKHLDVATMRHLVVLDLFERLENINIKIPKEFDFQKLVLMLKKVLCH